MPPCRVTGFVCGCGDEQHRDMGDSAVVACALKTTDGGFLHRDGEQASECSFNGCTFLVVSSELGRTIGDLSALVPGLCQEKRELVRQWFWMVKRRGQRSEVRGQRARSDTMCANHAQGSRRRRRRRLTRAERCLSFRPAPQGVARSVLRRPALVIPEAVKSGALMASSKGRSLPPRSRARTRRPCRVRART
jgi:hypothetical protein